MKAFAAGMIRLVCGTSVAWHSAVPTAGQKVFYANHSSHLDFLLIWSALPALLRETTRPVAAKDYWKKTKFRSWLSARLFNAVFIDRCRTGANPLQPVEQALNAGFSIIVFPEGTRSMDGDIGEFKRGLYVLARERPDLDFVPVYLKNLSRMLPKGEVLPVPVLTAVYFGAPLRLHDGEAAEPFLSRAAAAIKGLAQ